jgi:hypothetical protein
MGRCKHTDHYFQEYYSKFIFDIVPSREEINKFKLYQCKDCDKWISLTNFIKRAPLIIKG